MQKILILLLCIVFLSCKEHRPSIAIAIVPQPVSVQSTGGQLSVGSPRLVYSANDESSMAAHYLDRELSLRGISTAETGEPAITLQIIQYDTLVPEGYYHLSVTTSGVAIHSNTGVGLSYGIQSLLQLLPVKGSEIPLVEITDYPRFAYRGLHLDVGRHFFPVSFIKKYIDWLAFHKYNYFHWHLTEDQGWRIEIKKYPKLQEVGAFRKETLIGHARNRPEQFDGQPYGGYYTQDEIKEVVKYAQDRFVTIIPEIEMPGHSLAALASYPSLGCTGGPYAVATKWGVFNDVYCAGKEETFEFLQNVLDEIIPLFPSQYIHIGGDECPKEKWKTCPRCQARIKKEGLKDEHELQSYFIQRIEKYLAGKSKKIIGWDEILEGGLAPNATVMSWRGEKGGIEAAQQNHAVIMTPGKWCYFDHYQDSAKTEPLAIGGYLPLSKVYGYDPLPSTLNADESKFILGAQGNVWTEYMDNTDYVEYMVYPRASALAEVLWSPRAGRNYPDFLSRMETHLSRLDQLNIHYSKHILKEIETHKIH
ncbi:MAG TPA: beta-N-acetylhexosaminidase [Cyclobacteriaceae bacterium]|nr:beta-N-acetylhexosaminidase [Cyclobacteriaceae bacterium]